MKEYQEWLDFFVRHIPGSIGIIIRSRFYRKKFAAPVKGIMIQENVIIRGIDKLFIGENCQISYNSFISAYGIIRIGNNVGIGPGTKIYSDNHIHSDPEQPILSQGWEYKETIIEDDVWIGADSFIKPGVTIKTGCVVSAGSIVYKSLPGYSICAGNPARVVGWRKQPDSQSQQKE